MSRPEEPLFLPFFFDLMHHLWYGKNHYDEGLKDNVTFDPNWDHIRMKIFILSVASLLLAGCDTPIGQPGSLAYSLTKPSSEELEQRHISECLKLGFEPNTENFSVCRLKMKEIDAAYEGTGTGR